MVKLYYYQENDEPMTALHDSGEAVSVEEIEKLGVFYRQYDSPAAVDQLAVDRNYKNRDYITLDAKTFPGGETELDKKLDIFFKEHLHEDEEIRYILDGSGYFDFRGKDERWIRAFVVKNDLLILPAGIYHRFTLAGDKYDV